MYLVNPFPNEVIRGTKISTNYKTKLISNDSTKNLYKPVSSLPSNEATRVNLLRVGLSYFVGSINHYVLVHISL